jgi:hypothetical protein
LFSSLSRKGCNREHDSSASSSAKPKYHVPEVNLGEDSTADEGEHQLSRRNDSELSELLDSARQLMMAAVGFQTHYRINQRDSVLKSYRAALIISTDDHGWNIFHRRMEVIPEIKEKELTRDKALTLVFLAAFNKVDEGARKSASLFKRALNPSFVAQSPASEVLALLEKHGGFKGLARVNAQALADQAKSQKRIVSAQQTPVRRPTQPAGVTWPPQAATVKGPKRAQPYTLTIAATLIRGGYDLFSIEAGSEIELHCRLESLKDGVVITITDASTKE